MSLLEVKNLSVFFESDSSRLVPAVSDLSFSAEKGEILALVGESGCGKSVTCLSLARLLPEPPAVYGKSQIIFSHKERRYDVLKLNSSGLREFRRTCVGYIFQEPSVSLNPVFRVGDQIAESIRLRNKTASGEVFPETVRLLEQVGIPEPEKKMKAYPHELSGGMQQRIMIAMALAGEPDILIADEPSTALDVTIQAQILDLLRSIRDKRGMTILLVTHNLGIVAEMADRVIIMYAGHSMESGSVREIIDGAMHPYTKALLEAVPKLGREKGKPLATIRGNVPAPSNYPPGCRFYGRCALADRLSDSERRLCAEKVPEFIEIRKGRHCRCHYSK